jgi:4-amino-4-deoxy-L-arabinose transferase-like glycosyltransferase
VYLYDSPLSKAQPQEPLSFEKHNLSWGTDYKRQLAIHPPFLSILYYFWIRLFGDSEISLHIPVMIVGLLGGFLLYFFGSILFGSDVSFLATLATSFSISHIEYSTQAVHAIFEPFILLASLLCFYRFVITKNKIFFRGLLILNLFGILIYYHYFVYLVIQTMILWVGRKEFKVPKIYFISVPILITAFVVITAICFSEWRYINYLWMRSDFKTLVNIIISLPFNIIR